MSGKIYTVQELSQAVKKTLEGEFPFIWVQGQVGNISRPDSGHIYFTLKDEQSSLNVVWFKSAQRFVSGSVEAKSLDSGQEIIIAGRLAVYPPKGVYQMIAELVQDRGIGELHLQFQQMKEKLSGLGYFDSSRKKPLPLSPQKVGIITAPSGAAIRDFLHLAAYRGWGSNIRIYPSLVQGESAAEDIASAINLANQDEWAQVLVLLRGGGSLEDLWCFNTEKVAQAIYNSQIPILTGIGHEVDLCIADLTADMRASTPSHAAQLLWPERTSLEQKVEELEISLDRSWSKYFSTQKQKLVRIENALSWLSPSKSVERLLDRLEHLEDSLVRSSRQMLKEQDYQLGKMEQRLGQVSPQLMIGDLTHKLELLHQKIINCALEWIAYKEYNLQLLQNTLDKLDPVIPLHRGYSLVRKSKNNQLVRSPAQVESGEWLDIQTGEGHIPAIVDFEKPDS